MTGSTSQPKTSNGEEFQLPLKGFWTTITNPENGRVYRVEGMGDGRVRIHTLKRPSDKK